MTLQWNGWGINDVGPGWTNILNDLAAKLDELDCLVSVEQIKEKFGGLRFYFNTDGDFWAVQDLVSTAEARSYEICEECGRPGTQINKDYWVTTRCEDCA